MKESLFMRGLIAFIKGVAFIYLFTLLGYIIKYVFNL
jgi:hypothetical protein